MAKEKWILTFSGAKKDGRGRPKGPGKDYNYLRDVEGYETVPEEIVLDENAPVGLLRAVSLTNFLNGNPMDDNVRSMCERWQINAKAVSDDRVTHSRQIQIMRDYLVDNYSTEIMNLSQWMMNETTAGQGSVMAAMTGDYTRYGKPRNKYSIQ